METITQNKILRVGHSPDPDDAFMFYALSSGAVILQGYRIEHVIEDIQSLNRRALRAELEITAISAAVYPFVAKDYWILSSGASVGRNYGPMVVADRLFSQDELNGKRIAVPGYQTTAYLLLKIFLEDFVPVEMNFAEVIPAVQAGLVDAGLIIHEGQLNYASFGLQNCMDLGQLWFKKFNLPIPLGLDVARKDLGRAAAGEINRALRESIRYARMNEGPALRYALKYGRGISEETGRRFVGMYVNDDTENLGEEGARALDVLFRLGAEKKLFAPVKNLEVIE